MMLRVGDRVTVMPPRWREYEGVIVRVSQARANSRAAYWIAFPTHPWHSFDPFAFERREIEPAQGDRK